MDGDVLCRNDDSIGVGLVLLGRKCEVGGGVPFDDVIGGACESFLVEAVLENIPLGSHRFVTYNE